MQTHLIINRSTRRGFTLIELLIVIAIIAILAAMLLPVLRAAQQRGYGIASLNNVRQLSIGWIMYQGDNNETLMAVADNNPGSYTAINNSSGSPDYNYMDWGPGADVINTTGLVGPTALMAGFVPNSKTFKAPADNFQSKQNLGPRTRSYSMNGSLDGGTGGAPTFNNGIPGRVYFEARKVNDLRSPGPANIYVFTEEHPDSIDDMKFMVNGGYPNTGEHWRNLPGSIENGGAAFSYADGHSEIHRWQVKSGVYATVQQVHFYYPAQSPWATPTLVRNADYEWLDDRLPYHP